MASYNSFNYNYRPAKSIERKIFIEILKATYGVISDRSYEYIGLGSIFFTDFKLIHKELGITEMINIEQNETDKKRFEFNKPFSCIKLKWGMTNDVLPSLKWDNRKIIWLDYDQSLQNYMFEDIDTIFSNLISGSFFLFSCNSSFQRYYNNSDQSYRIEDFEKDFDGFSPLEIKNENLTKKKAVFNS